MTPAYRFAEVVLVVCLLIGTPAGASSIPGHLYAATKILAANPELAAVVGGNRAAYFGGAAGPDIAFVAANPKDRSAAGTESHYERTGDLCVSFLCEARTEQERAFALGWVSHWLTDIHIHTLVNAYGGNWETAAARPRHSQLEVVEVKHVHSIRGAVPGLERLTIDASQVPAAFINRVFAATYHKPAYQAQGGQPAVFEGLLAQAAAFIQTSTEYYEQASVSGTGKGDNALMELALSTYLSKVPTHEQYQRLLRPLEFVTATADERQITARLRVNDTRLYGKFLREWQTVMDVIAAYSPAVFGPAVALARRPGDTNGQAAVRAVLWNIDLDNPVRSPDAHARFRAAIGSSIFNMLDDKTLRGNPPVTDLLTASQVADSGFRIHSRLPITSLAQGGFDKSRLGELDLTIPVSEAEATAGGQYRVWVALGSEVALGQARLEIVEWASATGALGKIEKVTPPPTGTGVWALTKRWKTVFKYPNGPVEDYEFSSTGNTADSKCVSRRPSWRKMVTTSVFRHTWTEPAARIPQGGTTKVTVTCQDMGGSTSGDPPDQDLSIRASTGYDTIGGKSVAPMWISNGYAMASQRIRNGESVPSQTKTLSIRLPGSDYPAGSECELRMKVESVGGLVTEHFLYIYYPPGTPVPTGGPTTTATGTTGGGTTGGGTTGGGTTGGGTTGGGTTGGGTTGGGTTGGGTTGGGTTGGGTSGGGGTTGGGPSYQLTGPSSSYRVDLRQNPAGGRFTFRLCYTRPGTVLDMVGLNAAVRGDCSIQIRGDGVLTWQIHAPAVAGPARNANGWHLLASGVALQPGQWYDVVVTWGAAGMCLIVDRQVRARVDTVLPLTNKPIYLGDFPGDDAWGARHNIHPACSAKITNMQWQPL